LTLSRTGVGSLPHTDPIAASRFVQATSDVSYLPQLPNRHPQESMLVQWGDGMSGAGQDGRNLAVAHDTGDRSEAFAGATAVLGEFSGSVLKTQVTGPVTLAAALRAGGVSGEALLEQVADELLVRIDAHLTWIRSQVEIEDLVVILDEPSLAALGASESEMPAPIRRTLERVLVSIDASSGIHCCGDTDWGSIAAMRPDWMSWDLSALGIGFFEGADQIARALGGGSRVMWGMVPTTSGPLPEQNVLIGRYGTAVANLVVAGAPFESLKSRAWFTPGCGLAGLSESDAEAVTTLLHDVVEEVDSGW